MENYLDLKNTIDYTKLEIPAQIMQQGGIVIFPTETVYGIGVNGLDAEAVKKLYRIKQRPLNKPISLLISDMNMVNEVAQNITDLEYKLMKRFFPGPFTIILNKKDIVPDIVTANSSTVGVRMPSEEITRKLIEYANVPIAAPSANISDKPSGTNLENIIKDFEGKVDYFIDSGESKLGIASTIVKVIDGIPHILRQGTITKEQIQEISKEVIISI
jgi:L-threonylcarbamoyladenylate synthase